MLILIGGQTEVPSNPKKELRQNCEVGFSMTESSLFELQKHSVTDNETTKETDTMSSNNLLTTLRFCNHHKEFILSLWEHISNI